MTANLETDTPDGTTDLSWLGWALAGTAVVSTGGIILAAWAGKKAAERIIPKYAAFERAETDEERVARAGSLVREIVGDRPWLERRARAAIGLAEHDMPIIDEWHRERSLYDRDDVIQGRVYGKPGVREGEPIEIEPLAGQKIDLGRVVKTARSRYRLGEHSARKDFSGRR